MIKLHLTRQAFELRNPNKASPESEGFSPLQYVLMIKVES